MHTSLRQSAKPSAESEDEVASWKWEIDTAIQVLEGMEEMIPTSWKSKMMLQRLYDANQHIAQTTATQPFSPPSVTPGVDIAMQVFPASVGTGENLTLAVDVDLDDWLQTYNEHTVSIGTSTAWNGLLWDHTTMNNDANATPYAYPGNFTFGRPPIYRDSSG